MSNYWEKRAAQRMYEDMKTAEEAAEDIRKLYRRASLYIQSQGQDIFEAFRRKTGLTEAEARYYLTHAKSPADVQAVIDFAKQIQDPVRRQEILNWLRASATQSRLARLATLHEAIDNLVPLLYMQELALHQNVYRKILQDSYLHKVFDIQQYSGLGKYVAPMDAKRIDKLMHMRWLGSNYSSRLWGNTQRLAKSLRDELMVSWLTGRPQLATWRAIDAEFHKGQMAARRLIRTESNFLANQAHKEAYKDSGVDKYIYVATLDMKTSKICRSLDGKTFLVKNAQPGKNYPPMHPWCRSTTIAWMPDQLRAKMKRTARDPVTGRNYKVPANMTYNEWYKKYVAGNQNTAQPKYGERSLTKTQYENYKARLGDSFPYSYDEFIKMKSDKDKWAHWQKVYKDAKKKASRKARISRNGGYKDITDKWKAEKPLDKPDVVDASKYVAPDGTEYAVDGKHVVIDYKPVEKTAAEIVSKESGKQVEMQPRVSYPNDVNTPDIKINGVPYEIKSSEGTGENTIKNAVKRAKKQSDHVVLDLRNSPLDEAEIERQIKDTMTSDHTKFLKELVVVKGDRVEKVLER